MDYLTTCRPEPVTAAEMEAAIRTLPPEGDVTMLTRAQCAKIDSLAAVLRFHGRQSLYEIRVTDVLQAWLGLHGRPVLLISLPAVNLLEMAELQAVVAHETVHEYLWADWNAALAAEGEVRLRQVEAISDVIAALTLGALGMPVAPLVSAIEKVERYNRTRFGVPLNVGSYPSARERGNLVARFKNGKGLEPHDGLRLRPNSAARPPGHGSASKRMMRPETGQSQATDRQPGLRSSESPVAALSVFARRARGCRGCRQRAGGPPRPASFLCAARAAVRGMRERVAAR